MKTISARSLSIGSSLLVLLSLANGCATSPTRPGLRTTVKSGSGVRVTSVRVSDTPKGVQVSGTVGSTFGYFQSPRRHLDIEVLGLDGRLSSRTPTKFFPNPIRHSRFVRSHSSFAITLPEPPPAGSTVRVAVHATSIADCRN